MATPAANVETLKRYWNEALGWNKAFAGLPEYVGKLRDAQTAMIELTDASMDPIVRGAYFAPNSIFEIALTLEAGGATDAILKATTWTMPSKRPPRQLMLDRIYALASGGWWTTPDPGGMTTWLRSTIASGAACKATLLADGNPEVRAVLGRCIADVAIPAFWVEFLLAQRVFPSLEEQIKTSAWGAATRISLTGIASRADGRVTLEAARLAALTLPSFPTGDGAAAPTVPPAGKRWYRDGRLLASGAAGLVGGLYAAHKQG